MRPDFLFLGAQKAGTTWLHRNLCQHPEVWVLPLKKLHPYDRTGLALLGCYLRSRTPKFNPVPQG